MFYLEGNVKSLKDCKQGSDMVLFCFRKINFVQGLELTGRGRDWRQTDVLKTISENPVGNDNGLTLS